LTRSTSNKAFHNPLDRLLNG